MSDDTYNTIVESRIQAFAICTSATKDLVVECDLNVSQSATADIMLTQEVTSDANAALINSLMTKINAKVQEVIEQKNDTGILSDIFGESNDSNITNNIDNSIRADLSIKLNQQSQAQARSSSGQANTANISYCAGHYTGKDCTITQNTSLELYITQVVSLAAKVVSENAMAQDVAEIASVSVSQTNTNWLSDFIAALSMMEKIIIIAIIAIVIIAIIFALVIVLRSMGSSGKSNGADYSVGRNVY
jgi:hypothetical protein